MAKMKNLLVVAALFAVTVVGFASCDSLSKGDPADALIGKWMTADKSAGVELKSDGTYIIGEAVGGEFKWIPTSKWTATETEITIYPPEGEDDAPATAKYTLSGNTLTLVAGEHAIVFIKQ